MRTTELTAQNEAAANPTSLVDPIRDNGALLPTRNLTLHGIPTRYHQSGDGQNIVLLHGFPETLNGWHAVAPDLANDHRVHAFDWPGLGPDAPSFPNPSPWSFADFVLDALDELEIENPVLVGTDIAMLPALLAAGRRPTVAGVVVMDGRPFPGNRHLSWELRAMPLPVIGEALAHLRPRLNLAITWKRGFAGRNPLPGDVKAEFASWARNRSQRTTGLSYFRNFDPALEQFQQTVASFATPLHVIWGADDNFISSDMGRDLVTAVPGSSMTTIADAGHYVHMERPTQVAAAIRHFAAGLST